MPDVGESAYIIPLARSVTDVDVTNTTTETNMFTYTVPAGLLGTNRILRLSLLGTYVANSVTPTMSFRVYYGATLMYADTIFGLGATAFLGGWEFIFHLSARNATNVQELNARLLFGNRAACVTGIGDLGSSSSGAAHPIEGTAAEDSTTALDLRVTAQWSGANTTYHFTTKTAILELLP